MVKGMIFLQILVELFFDALTLGDIGGDFHPHVAAIVPLDRLVTAFPPLTVDGILKFPDMRLCWAAISIEELVISTELTGPLLIDLQNLPALITDALAKQFQSFFVQVEQFISL